MKYRVVEYKLVTCTIPFFPLYAIGLGAGTQLREGAQYYEFIYYIYILPISLPKGCWVAYNAIL